MTFRLNFECFESKLLIVCTNPTDAATLLSIVHSSKRTIKISSISIWISSARYGSNVNMTVMVFGDWKIKLVCESKRAVDPTSY